MTKINTNYQNNLISFKSKESIVKNLSKKDKLYYGFIKQRENLSTSRFCQDVTTNWIPKVVFTRSLADFSEMTFLEYTESALFYFAPMLLCKSLGNAFTKFTPKSERNVVKSAILKPTDELLNLKKIEKNKAIKRAIPIKAAIVLSCFSIPAAEYALSFAKNLLTLKVFKKSDFNNIANLNQKSRQTEDKTQQNRVKRSSEKHIKNATVFSAISVLLGTGLALFGHKSETLQKISKTILRPGNLIFKGFSKLGLKSDKVKKGLNTYINFDCDIKNNKPTLSKGQLVASTLIGFCGYNSAGKDRGKLDQMEVLTRVPVVVLYTIFGSDAFDWAYKHILLKRKKYPDLIKQKQNSKAIEKIPERSQLESLAKDISHKKHTPVDKEFKRLIKEKALISAIPYGFSLVFMGFLLAGISRVWTQYRYNKTKNTIVKNMASKNKIKALNFKNKYPWNILSLNK